MKLKKALEENYKIRIALAIITLLLIGILIATPKLSNYFATPNIGYSITDDSTMEVKHLKSNTTLDLEVASTPQKREKGLMFRDKLETNKGMIFIFPSEMPLSFWMKDTSISLDMIFLNKDLKVISIFSNTKINQMEEIYASEKDSQFVIETLAGWSELNKVRPGDLFEIISSK